MEKRKPYKAPIFRQVRLEVKTSVLAVCQTSTNTSPLLSQCHDINGAYCVGTQ
jgi:hypothetical protein